MPRCGRSLVTSITLEYFVCTTAIVNCRWRHPQTFRVPPGHVHAHTVLGSRRIRSARVESAIPTEPTIRYSWSVYSTSDTDTCKLPGDCDFPCSTCIPQGPTPLSGLVMHDDGEHAWSNVVKFIITFSFYGFSRFTLDCLLLQKILKGESRLHWDSPRLSMLR